MCYLRWSSNPNNHNIVVLPSQKDGLVASFLMHLLPFGHADRMTGRARTVPSVVKPLVDRLSSRSPFSSRLLFVWMSDGPMIMMMMMMVTCMRLDLTIEDKLKPLLPGWWMLNALYRMWVG